MERGLFFQDPTNEAECYVEEKGNGNDSPMLDQIFGFKPEDALQDQKFFVKLAPSGNFGAQTPEPRAVQDSSNMPVQLIELARL